MQQQKNNLTKTLIAKNIKKYQIPTGCMLNLQHDSDTRATLLKASRIKQ
jgi:hypothetical protein